MVSQIIVDQPKEPMFYMIEWLQNLQGKKQHSHMNMEKTELMNLRKEIKKCKEKYAKQDDEMKVDTESEESEEEEEKDQVDKIIEMKKQAVQGRGQRSSVSAEVYGKFNKKEDFKPNVIHKTDEQKKRISSRMMMSFLFNSLEDKDLVTVIDAMEEKRFKAGDSIIRQGESGDVLYLIEEGLLDCYKKFKKDDEDKYLKTYNPGEAFGELALLYNAPRAATIKAKTDSILWALDRETFNNIVKEAAMKKREKYEAFLKNVEILKEIEAYELSQIADALTVQSFNKDDYIIKQNDPGDNFYIILEGEAKATKIFKQGANPEFVMDYAKGGYFGELALIKNEPRAANVIAKTDCKLLKLDRMSFKRLLGPIENILKRNSGAYIKFMGNK
jgi:cAMP-dependent protein kinase regulator